MKTITVLFATTVGFTLAVHAQQDTDRQSDDRSNTEVAGEVQTYSQAESLAHELPLDLVAINDPGAFEGITVLDSSDEEIGAVAEITRRRSDQALHAIISLANGARAALPIAELSLDALAYYDPAQSLSDQPYVPAEFAQISQYQAGHSARGSLSDPGLEATVTPLPRNDPDQATEPVGLPQQPTIEQQARAAAAPLPTPAPGPDNGSVAASSYIASGSSIVQLALTNPDALQLKELLDETGKPLGEISHIAKNIANQELYAVINMNTQHGQAAVKLDALSIARLAYLGDTGKLTLEDFDEEDFLPITGQ